MTTATRSTVLQQLAAATLALCLLLVLFPTLARAEVLTRQLQIEMTGSDVSTLQSFLAQDTTIYPQGLVTGYFGFLTKSAVSNYQSSNGIDPVGRVGPITLVSINARLAGGVGTSGGDVHAPLLSVVNVNAGRTNAEVSWSTSEQAKGVVYYSTSPLTEYEHMHSVTISGDVAMTDTTLRNTQNVAIANLQPNTTYYYDVYVTDANGNVTMSMQKTFRTTN